MTNNYSLGRPRTLNLKRLGKRFKEARENAGLLQHDLGPAGHVSKIEHGKVTVTVDTLWRWAQKTGERMDYLTGMVDV